MGYSIWMDMEEVNNNPDKWINHGRNVLIESCKHHNKETGKEETIARYQGWCDKCDISEDSAIPIMNYLYPLECKNFDEESVLKIVKETNCSLLENQDSGEWFLSLCGGGMDLSQDIAYSFQILENWMPKDLLLNVCSQPLLSLGEDNYKKLALGIIKQLEMGSEKFKEKAKEWEERLASLQNKVEA